MMKSLIPCALASLAVLAGLVGAADDSFHAPDTLVLKNGRRVHGLIVRNTAHDVLMQEQFNENSYPKSEIDRIIDVPDVGTEFTKITEKGDLPSWRVILNDLRSHDRIQSLVEIPAVRVEEGVFRNVPYKAFRINDHIELDIYGDPEDPIAIEFGVFGPRQFSTKLRKFLRTYLAGFLNSRAEIAALYGIGLKEGTQRADDLIFEVTPRTAPDAFGAWWISLYNEKDVNASRLSDAEYARLTLPSDQVMDRHGHLKSRQWTREDLNKAPRHDGDDDEIIQRGFYRDKKGVFHLLPGTGSDLPKR